MSETCKRCGLPHPEYERCWDAMRHELAIRDEFCAALQNENAALRDAIEALHDAVEGKRFDDASVAELLNGAMKIPSANARPHAEAVADSVQADVRRLSDDEILQWAKRYDIQRTAVELRSMVEDATTLKPNSEHEGRATRD